MLSEERLNLIRQHLAKHGKVLSADLALEFGCSEDTIRRDLRELARTGYCKRVYGGALAHPPGPAPNPGSIMARRGYDAESKARLAQVAVAALEGCNTIFIDASSTNLAIAEALPRDRKINVITNAPAIAVALGDHPLSTTIMIGGLFNSDKGICYGPQTLREIENIYADAFVLGACGVDAGTGLTALDPSEAEVKRAMVNQSAKVLVASITSKLGTVAPFRIMDASSQVHLIVDHDIDEELLGKLRQTDMKIGMVPR